MVEKKITRPNEKENAQNVLSFVCLFCFDDEK